MSSHEASPELTEMLHEMHEIIHQWLERTKDKHIPFHMAAMGLVQCAGIAVTPLFFLHHEHQDRLAEMCRMNLMKAVAETLENLKNNPEVAALARKHRMDMPN